MTKLRFILNLVVVLLFYSAVIILSANNMSLFISITSLIVAILIPYFIISFVFTPLEQIKFTKEIFKPVGMGEKKELEKSIICFNFLKRILITSSIAAVIMGVVCIMASLEDRTSLGPNLAFALIVPFYVAIFTIIVVEPLRAAAEKNLNG